MANTCMHIPCTNHAHPMHHRNDRGAKVNVDSGILTGHVATLFSLSFQSRCAEMPMTVSTAFAARMMA